MAWADRDALSSSFDRRGALRKYNWDSQLDLSQWHGIKVNGQGRAVGRTLRDNRLRGIYRLALCRLKLLMSAKYLVQTIFEDPDPDGPATVDSAMLAAIAAAIAASMES